MTIDRNLVRRLGEAAIDGSVSNPEAVGTLVAAATDILLRDIGPQGAVWALERLVSATRAAFLAGETVQ